MTARTNHVILKLCDTIVLKTLPLVVQCKFFADECARTKPLVRKTLRF